jgi:outer membrane protein, heavy metal efflux system
MGIVLKGTRRLVLWLLFGGILALGWCAPLGAEVPAGMPPGLAALIDEALKANPDIRQRSELAAAAKETIRSAKALDDPDLLISLKDLPVDTWKFNQDGMTQKMVMLSQKIPFPGKRQTRSEVAASQAQADTFLFEDKVKEVRAKVIQSYWDLSLAGAAFGITRKNKELWEQAVQVAEARYGAGQGLQADVLQAQVELGSYLDRQLQWQQRRESAQAELNALRSQPPQTPVPPPAPLKLRSAALKLDELLEMAKDNPRLQALNAGIDKQGKSVSLAKKDYFPDFTFQAAYGFRENLGDLRRPDMFTGSLMVNLPIWHAAKIKPRIREEQARENAAKGAYDAAFNQVQAAVKDRHAKLQRLSQQSALYAQGIIPQARQAAEAALAAYQAGPLDFARLTQNFIALYAAELQLQEYLKDFENTWAELEWLVGRDLPRVGATP